MKKFFFLLSIIFLLVFTTITKNSTKQIEKEIYNINENIRIQKKKYEMVLQDFTNKANKLNVPVDLVITDYVQNRDYKEGLEELKKGANRQYSGEEMLFNFGSQSTEQLEEIANRSDRKKLVEVMGEGFVNALEAELIRRDEQ